MEDFQIRHVRNLEKTNQWELAADFWRKCGRKTDADACQMIADSIAKGNAYREEVDSTIGREPQRHTDEQKWLKWHESLREIYNKHFKYDRSKNKD